MMNLNYKESMTNSQDDEFHDLLDDKDNIDINNLKSKITLEDLRYYNRIYLLDLADQAGNLLHEYQSFVSFEEKRNSYDWRQQSILNLHIQRNESEDGGLKSLQMQWSKIEFYGAKGNRVPFKRSIKKMANSDNYSFHELRKYAKDWEWSYVEELEKKLGWLRRQSSFIAKSNESLRYAIVAREKYIDYYGEEEDND